MDWEISVKKEIGGCFDFEQRECTMKDTPNNPGFRFAALRAMKLSPLRGY
jgi:hypothetical protein